jgi:hypothetical protein
VNVLRLVVGGAVAAVGGAVAVFAMAREWLADPLGLDWLDASRVDQQVLGGDVNNWLLFMAGGMVFGLGAWIAGRTDDWLG